MTTSSELILKLATISVEPQLDIESMHVVEKCHPDFFYQKIKQAYPLFKNPRGLCIIVNIYQIDGMPPRRWSDRDTIALTQLFEQMMFQVEVYTDSTHNLNANVS